MGRISTIGIPTRNRTNELERCIRSYLPHIKTADRPVDFCIIDDSTKPEITKKNQAMLLDLANDEVITIRYLNHQQREKWAELLANQLGIPNTITRFALLGDERCPTYYGACRNALLLDAAGCMSIQADDDTLGLLGKPDNWRQGLSLSAKYDPNKYHFFKTSKAALQSVGTVKQNIFSIHESLLGKSAIDIIADTLQSGFQPEIHYASADLFDKVARQKNTVSTTYLGIVGDSGMREYASRLFLENNPEKLSRLSEATHKHNLTTRFILKSVFQNTLCTGWSCMTLHIGLDTRNFLPPFMPVMRNEDGLFGIISSVCFPESISGFLPYTIQHLPPELRTSPTPQNASKTPGIRVNDILRQFVLHACHLQKDHLSLEELGDHLTDLGSLPLKSFEQYTRNTILRMYTDLLAYTEQRRDQHSMAPEFWKENVSRYIESIQTAMDDPARALPMDLFGNVNYKLGLFKDLVFQFGGLLGYWRLMYNAARNLSADLIGSRPFV